RKSWKISRNTRIRNLSFRSEKSSCSQRAPSPDDHCSLQDRAALVESTSHRSRSSTDRDTLLASLLLEEGTKCSVCSVRLVEVKQKCWQEITTVLKEDKLPQPHLEVFNYTRTPG